VMDDKRLVSIALATPKTQADLEALNLTPRQVYVFGDNILQAVMRGKKAYLIQRTHTGRPDPNFLNRLNLLSGWRKDIALKIGVESDIVLPKAWMHTIAEQNPKNMLELSALMPKAPWRLEAFGVEILKTLQNREGSSQK
jgi:ribonuclease D